MTLPGRPPSEDPARVRETIRVPVPGAVQPTAPTEQNVRPPGVAAQPAPGAGAPPGASRTQTLLDLPRHAQPPQAAAPPRARTPGAPRPILDGLQGRLGDHELLGLLGRGGMGAVYKAIHTPTGAHRALKVLAPGGTIDVARFKREAESMAAVGGHPNVLRIHTAGEATGILWYAMDVAEGGSLEGRLTSGPLPPLEVARLGAALARGLAHVHDHGILHRDLKPANVLFDSAGTPMIVDFGLAAVEGSDRLTETGVVVGTPLYMAPEQVTGDRAAISPATDVYGLGAVLYEAATGHPPVDGSSSIEVMTRVVHAPPIPLRERVPTTPRALEVVVLRCLEKSHRRRYPTARALADDLEAVAAGRRPAALGASPWSGPIPALAGGALVALALAGAAVVAQPRGGDPAGDAGPVPSAAGTAPPPATPSAPPLAGASLDEELAELLGREDEAEALRRLDAAGRDARAEAALAPLVVAVLAVADEPAARAPWLARAAPLAEAARSVEALGRPGGPRPRLPGHGAVVDALADLARVAAEWRAAFQPVTTSVLLSVERLVREATASPADALGVALRVRTQRAVAALDGILARNHRVVDERTRVLAALSAAERLAPASHAAAALRLTTRFIEWRALGQPSTPPGLDALAALPARYATQRVAALAMTVYLADPRAPEELERGLAAWERLRSDGRSLELLEGDPGAEVMGRAVLLERALLADFVVGAYEHVALLRVWHAWAAHGTPLFVDRLAVARRVTRVVHGFGKSRGAELATVVELMAGSTTSAASALAGAPGDIGAADRPLRLLEAEVALLSGEVERARRCLRELLPSLTDLRGYQAEARLSLAAVEAQAGDLDAATRLLDEARDDLARAGRTVPPLVPWRSPEVTAKVIEAARGGWRSWTARRCWPPGC